MRVYTGTAPSAEQCRQQNKRLFNYTNVILQILNQTYLRDLWACCKLMVLNVDLECNYLHCGPPLVKSWYQNVYFSSGWISSRMEIDELIVWLSIYLCLVPDAWESRADWVNLSPLFGRDRTVVLFLARDFFFETQTFFQQFFTKKM